MEFRVLASTVLLVVCIVVCVGQENDQVVTASVLRRELNRAMHAMVVTASKCSFPATLLLTQPPPARRSSSWPHSLSLVSTGSGEPTIDPDKCTVTWRGVAKV